jgi:hypothetical protein
LNTNYLTEIDYDFETKNNGIDNVVLSLRNDNSTENDDFNIKDDDEDEDINVVLSRQNDNSTENDIDDFNRVLSTEDDIDDFNGVLSRERRGVNFYRTGTTLARQISTTLDRLLGPKYNKRIRPMFGGPPVIVELNLSIRSIVSLVKRFSMFMLIRCLFGVISYFKNGWS